jgi:hypothetical protein
MSIGSRTSALNPTRRLLALAGVLALTLATAGCGDSEADQRKAFIKFLDDINHRVGVHFLVPTQEDRAAFGDYMRHYTVILDFNKDMKVISNDYQDGLKKIGIGPNVQPQTLEQMVARRQGFPRLKEATVKMMQAYESRLAKANAERGALQQPDDLKAVYITAFDKLVTAPVQGMITADKALLDVLDCSTRLAEYINGHRTNITLSGSQMRANDAKTLAELNALLKAHQEAQKRLQDAQRAGERVTRGS